MEKFILIVPSFDGVRYTLNKDYLKLFKNIDIPYFIGDYNYNFFNKNIGGILLTGGGDISEKYLKEPLHKMANDIFEERDTFEINLLKNAYINKIPTLAICRGAQIMNIAFGGNINQHIEGHLQKEDRNVATHSIEINKQSEFYKIIKKDNIKVNSIHHQVIKSIPNKFKFIGHSNDNYIEGIELINEKMYFLGVQWHPEALNDENSKKIFESFLKRVYNLKQ